MPKKILLLDVSHLFFRAFFAIPRTLTDRNGDPINAVFGVSSMILSLLESQKPDYIFGAKDEKGPTKRHEKMPEYKGHRPEMPSELVSQLPKIFEIFEAFGIPLFSQTEFEADDFLATIAEQYRGNADFTVEIVTGDHDAFQLVQENICICFPQNGSKAPLVMDRNGIFEKVGVYPEQIADYKALVGDASDNMKGVEGIGKKTAAKLLKEYGSLEALLENAEHVKGKMGERLRAGKEIALFTKEMAVLHRDLELPDFDLEQGCVQKIDLDRLDSFFRKYNFHSLLNRFPKIFPQLRTAETEEEEQNWKDLEEAQQKILSTQSTEKESDEEQMLLF